MTLGDGIFYATLLVVVAVAIHQISVRHKWKLVGKLAGGLALLGGLAGGVAWLWDQRQSDPAVPRAFMGVQLGMTPVEVTLAIGEPDEKLNDDEKQTKEKKDEQRKSEPMYLYGKADQASTFVRFYDAKEGGEPKVEWICRFNGNERLLGFGSPDSTETEISQKLGQPSDVSIQKDGLRKTLTYSKWKVAYEFQRGHVVVACLTDNPKMTYVDEYPSTSKEQH